jgi:hypothetical protein
MTPNPWNYSPTFTTSSSLNYFLTPNIVTLGTRDSTNELQGSQAWLSSKDQYV